MKICYKKYIDKYFVTETYSKLRNFHSNIQFTNIPSFHVELNFQSIQTLKVSLIYAVTLIVEEYQSGW